MDKQKLHYGWIILIISFFVVASSLGIGRFSYGMLLPSLQEGINLTHSESGFIASANMLGYSLGALVVGSLVFRFGSRVIISASLLGAGLSMMAIGFAGGFLSVSILRFITGFGSAGANIAVMGLSSLWVSKNYRGIANGFLVGGSGVAILFTGRLVPSIMGLYPEYGWRYNWFILGGMVLLIGFLSWILIKNRLQGHLASLGSCASNSADENINCPVFAVKDIINFPKVRIIAFTYFCYGISYIIYATFFVNYLVGEKGLPQSLAGDIWSTVGLLSIGSALIWGSISDKIGRPYALTVVYFLQGTGYVIAAAASGQIFMWVSAVIFGLTAWSIPGIMASYCGDLLGPRNATTLLGLVTLIFSIGSIIGPSSGGFIKEISSSFASAFYLAAFFAVLGGMLSFMQQKKGSGNKDIDKKQELTAGGN